MKPISWLALIKYRIVSLFLKLPPCHIYQLSLKTSEEIDAWSFWFQILLSVNNMHAISKYMGILINSGYILVPRDIFWNCGYIKISIPPFQDKCQNFFSTKWGTMLMVLYTSSYWVSRTLKWYCYVYWQPHLQLYLLVYLMPRYSKCPSPGKTDAIFQVHIFATPSTDIGPGNVYSSSKMQIKLQFFCLVLLCRIDPLGSHTNLQKASDSIILYFY